MRRREIERLLPQVFTRTAQPGSPLFALLQVMEELHQPSEDVLARLPTYFNPRQARDAFVPYLARWVDLERLLVEADRPSAGLHYSLPTGLGRLRELVAAAAFLARWRGTAKGLVHFLETATGLQGFELDEDVPGPDGTPRPYHVQVRAPSEAAPYEPMLERIIQMEKPAYVTHELVFHEPEPQPEPDPNA